MTMKKINAAGIICGVVIVFGVSLLFSYAGTSKIYASIISDKEVVKKNVKTRTETLPAFTGIVSNAVCDIKLVSTTTDKYRAVITEERDARLGLNVKDGILYIDNKNRTQENGAYIVINVPTINSVALNGVGDFETEGKFVTESLSVKLNGVGDVEMKELVAVKANIALNGVGDIDMTDARISYCRLAHNGVGDIEIGKLESDRLECDLNGTGDIEVKGNAIDAVYKCNGVGSIEAKSLKAETVEAKCSSPTGEIEYYAIRKHDVSTYDSDLVKGHGPACKK